ncbi:gluconate 2-dehydrogenase subunit 3 family protein [Terrimonas ferruginea]|uniref:gluconate 2-dehydrogenase subunit 3 family protein n=1 Tax=Terrimonas ferruginea TaxID=249 RepID=UPI0004086810|nr:gluconate 2-dehydrogenase subunit 3 family protein [Terrimonas ferruginea]
MERRELLKMIAVLTGTAMIGGDLLLSGCGQSPTIGGTTFSTDDIRFLDEVAETILPKTKTPGAKDAAVGQFMTVMVNDTYTKDDQKIFHEGIGKLNDASKEQYKKAFLDITPEQRHELLNKLNKEATEYNEKKSKADKESKDKKMPAHYFTMMKQLTILGFFTSEPGATQVLRHVAVPGKYDGCLDYKKGDRAWG